MSATTAPGPVDRSRRAPAPRRRRRRWPLAVLAGVVVAGLLSAAPILLRALRADGDAVAVAADRVTVSGTRFGPPAVTVAAGGTVTFAWTDGSEHDLVFDDGVRVDPRDAGTWSRTFDEPGTYPFRCSLHPFMDGRVDVS